MADPVLSPEGETEEEARDTAAGLEGEVYSVRDWQSGGGHAGFWGRRQGNHAFCLARGDQGATMFATATQTPIIGAF